MRRLDPYSSTLPKGRTLLWVAIVILLVWDMGHWSYFNGPVGHAGVDSLGYWASGRVFLQGGNPYDPKVILPVERNVGYTDSRALIMWSPPWVLTLFLPFVLLPFGIARAAWFFVNVISVLWAAALFWKPHGGKNSLWIVWLAALLFVPGVLALNRGQASPLLLFGLIAFVWAVENGFDLRAGCFALLITLKPHAVYLFWAFLVLWIVQTRRWKVFFSMAGALSLLVLLTWFIHPAIYSSYLGGLTSDYGALAWETPTLSTALRMLFPSQRVWLPYLPTLLGILLGFGLWFRWRKEFEWRQYLIPITLLSTITTPYSWPMDWIVLLPVVLLVIMRFRLHPRRQWPSLLSLIVMQIVMTVQIYAAGNYFVLVWVAPALVLIHLFSSLAERGADNSSPLHAIGAG